ncbi:MAG TPA: proline dehydrogenase family protein [Acidimicrobiia bacterium]|nr:proline dehydrogenase family protein [Acidimicrobiia bacterium]
MAERFVAGDTLDSAVTVAHTLNELGFTVSLDLLGEEVIDVDSAGAALAEYLSCLDRIESEGLDANISIKPTQLGLAIEESLAREAVIRLGRRAAEVGTTVTIDMEDSRYTEATVRLFELGQAETANFGVALQSYLKRTPEDLERLIPLGGHIRLCKGAYLEPAEVAIQSKSIVDAAFEQQMKRLMAADETIPAIATHDSRLLDVARDLATDRAAPYEFQMLYGVRADVQRELVAGGFPLRIYLPFGSQWYPYLTRRLAERPSNAWFLARAVLSGS